MLMKRRTTSAREALHSPYLYTTLHGRKRPRVRWVGQTNATPSPTGGSSAKVPNLAGEGANVLKWGPAGPHDLPTPPLMALWAGQMC